MGEKVPTYQGEARQAGEVFPCLCAVESRLGGPVEDSGPLERRIPMRDCVVRRVPTVARCKSFAATCSEKAELPPSPTWELHAGR